MATTKKLGEQVNDLRAKLGMKPYKEPSKQGATKLTVELHDLQQEDLKRNPPPPPPAPEPEKQAEAAPQKRKPASKPTEFSVLEEVDEDALIQPKVPETIKAMSYRLLTHIHRTDPSDNRTVGLLYSTIVALVRKKFPKAETSLECLRWYSVHMRQEGIRLPQKRPRPLTRV